MIGIYKITNTINNKSYVGCSSVSVEGRIKCHLECNDRGSQLVKFAIMKYGREAFISEVIEECCVEDLKDRERYWISFYDTIAPKGYNLTSGGEGYEGWHFAEEVNRNRKPHSEETKQKIGDANRGQRRSESQLERIRVASKLRNSRPEVRAKISKANSNPSLETREKMSRSQKKRFENSPSTFKGCHHSEESRKKISDSAKLRVGDLGSFFGRNHSDETKAHLSQVKSDSNRGRHWFTNGVENRFMNDADGEFLIKQDPSWRKGQTQYWNNLSNSSTRESITNEKNISE